MSTQTIFLTAGATSKSCDIALVQKAAATAPGDPITGLAFNTSNLTAYYRLPPTGTLTQITLATQTVGGAYSSGGFVEISSTNAPGEYRFDIPNACIAAAGECNITFNGAANMETHTLKIIVTAVDLYDSVRGGMTALPNAAAAANGGLPTVDAANGVKVSVGTAAGQLNVSGGKAPATIAAGDLANNSLTAAALATDAVTEIAAGILSAASSTPITANTTQINSHGVLGTGTSLDLWRGA